MLKTAEQCQACGHGPGDPAHGRAAFMALVALAAWAIPPINEAIGEVVRQVLDRLAAA